MAKAEKPLNKWQAYKKRQQEKGLTFVSVWIPEDDEVKLKKYAERKRTAHEKRSEKAES